MKQKLAIARALLHEPSVLFFDEPTSGLDPEAAFIVREAIARLSSGRTIVLSTHNLDEAERLCDRVAFVRGEVLRVDSPARLRRPPGPRSRSSYGSAAGAAPRGVRAVPAAAGAVGTRPDPVRLRRDTRRDTPVLVRRLVAAAPTSCRQERTATLESVYFDVMGRPAERRGN